MVLQGWVRWTNPPTAGGLELVAENLVKQHQAVRVGSHHQYITSYRGVFPSDPSSSEAAGASGAQEARTLHTVLSPTSPFAFALFPSAKGKERASDELVGSAEEGEEEEEEEGLMVAMSPPGSLNSMLNVTKSPFLQQAAAVKPTNPGAGLVTDMTPSNSSRNTRPAAQMLKLDGQIFEIAYPRSSPFIPGLAPPPDGLARENEYVIRLTGATAAGGISRGLLLEVEWFPLAPEAGGDARTPAELDAAFRAFLACLVPQAEGRRTQVGKVAVCADGAKAVDRGRASARLLLELLKQGGLL